VATSSSLLAFLPHGIVESERGRRALKRLGARSTSSRAARALPSSHLDLLPQGALRDVVNVIDVGANEGRWSLDALALTRPEKLIAIEPSPQSAARLRSNLRKYSCVEIEQSAVGAYVGEATLNVTSHSHSTSVLTPRTDEMNAIYGSGYDVLERVTLPMKTLDVVAKHLHEVSILKIDVQGLERQVLAGATETLKRTRWLLIEVNFRHHYDGDALFPELDGLLSEIGFQLFGISPVNVIGAVPMWADALYHGVWAEAL